MAFNFTESRKDLGTTLFSISFEGYYIHYTTHIGRYNKIYHSYHFVLKHIGRKLLFFIIILIPFWSFLVWFFWPKQEIKGLILDKTVLTSSGDEHRSLNWVLTHERYTKPNGTQYDISSDYFGFFPVSRPEYQIKDLSPFSNLGLDSMAGYYNWSYYTDAYGIYQNEWYAGKDINERSRKIYGGLTKQDYVYMRMMYEKRKLVLTEFNIIASPTPLSVRDRVSNLLGIDFSGWTGRYYHSLDTIENPDIPKWMKRLHMRYYDEPFDYEDIPGIVLINENEKIVVLQIELDLNHEVPIIHTKPEYQLKYGVPDYIRYPFWFDITFAEDTNNIFATYSLNVTGRGDSTLKYHNLPFTFPAIIGDVDEGLKYYFCGDFSDNPIPFGLSYFKGVEYIRKIFYNNRDPLDRQKFFWEYYRPMITTIVNDYKKNVMPDSNRVYEIRPVVSNPDYVPFYRRYRLRRPDLGREVDKMYSPNTIYGAEGRENVSFNADSDYEDEEANVNSEDNSFDGFLKNVEQATGISDDENGNRDATDEQAEVDNSVAREERRKREQRGDSIRAYRKEQQRKQEQKKERQNNSTVQPVYSSNTQQTSKEITRFKVGGRKPLNNAFFIKQEATQEPEQTYIEPTEEVEEQEPVKEVKEDKPIVKKLEPKYTKPAEVSGSTNFKVIIASFESKQDADDFITKMNVSAEIFYVSSVGSNRVVISQNNSLLEAQQSLASVTARFPKAWISKF